MVSRSQTLIYISIFSWLEASDKILKILDQVNDPVLSRSAITRRKKKKTNMAAPSVRRSVVLNQALSAS